MSNEYNIKFSPVTEAFVKRYMKVLSIDRHEAVNRLVLQAIFVHPASREWLETFTHDAVVAEFLMNGGIGGTEMGQALLDPDQGGD